MRVYCVVILLLGFVVSCASPAPREVQSQLAPTGTLRVGLNLTNTLLTAKDPAGGEPRGVAVDIARELGRRVGVPVKLLSYDSSSALGGSIQSGQWDIAFFAIEPARAGQVDFSPGYVEIETTYMVRKDSPLRAANEVDRDGVVVAVTRGAGYEPILAGMVKRAKLVRTSGIQENVKLLSEKNADAFVGLRPALINYSEKESGFRVLDGHFVAVQQAIGIQKDRSAAAEYVRSFVQDIKRSGFLAKVIADNNVRGLTIAK
jgi:polar amino acid transport system substrate-binding protein